MACKISSSIFGRYGIENTLMGYKNKIVRVLGRGAAVKKVGDFVVIG